MIQLPSVPSNIILPSHINEQEFLLEIDYECKKSGVILKAIETIPNLRSKLFEADIPVFKSEVSKKIMNLEKKTYSNELRVQSKSQEYLFEYRRE